MFYIYYLFGRCKRYAHRASRVQQQLVANLMKGTEVPSVLQEPAARIRSTSQNVEADMKKLSFLFFLQNAVSITVKCNYDFAAYGDHVNNARYPELVELGRCHHNALLNLATIEAAKGSDGERTGFLVAGTSTEFVREIAVGAEVLISSQLVAGDTPETITYLFSIWSKDGKLLHSTSCLNGVLVGTAAYKEKLDKKFNSAAAPLPASDQKHKWVKIRPAYLLADVNGLTCVKEIEEMLLASRKRMTEDGHKLSKERFSDFGNKDLISSSFSPTGANAEGEMPPPPAAPRDWIRGLGEAQRALRKHFRKVTF